MPAFWIPKRLVEVGLVNTAAEMAESFVRHCEIGYEARIMAAAKETVGSGCRVVMLTGPSASGKTTTALKLQKTLQVYGKNAVTISLDDFYKNIDIYPRLADGSKDYESVDALDIEEIHRCLLSLLENGCCDLPQFDFEKEERKAERKHLCLGDGVVFVEGIHALNPRLTSVLPQDSVFKIYAGLREEYSHGGQRFLPTRDVRLARRLVRDSKFRGHSIEKTMSLWPRVCEGEDLYIKSFKSHADLLVDTSFSYEICVLAPFIERLKDTMEDTTYGRQLNSLADRFSHCHVLSDKYVPKDSMLREFLG